MRWGTHGRWERIVESRLDGEPAGSRGELALVHLRDCPACRRLVLLLVAVRASLRRGTAQVPPLSPAVAHRLVEHLLEDFASST